MLIGGKNEENIKYKFRFITLGVSGVGKTCFLKRYVTNKYTGEEDPTLLSDMHTKIIEVEEQKIKLVLCDTAGTERFYAMTSNYLRGACGVFFVYDITNQESFDKLEKYYEDAMETAANGAAFCLIGTKLDEE